MSSSSTGESPSGAPARPRRDHVRRLAVASVAFALAVGVVVWLLTALILSDLDQQYVTSVLTQARGETEGLVRVLDVADGAEGEVADQVEGVPGGPFDPVTVLNSVIEDEGTSAEAQPLGGPEAEVMELPSSSTPGGGGRRVAATLSTAGQETRWLLDGELIHREAIQAIRISYPGGSRVHLVQTIDKRDYDESRLDSELHQTQRVIYRRRPSSRPITIRWDSFMNGQPVQLEATVDRSVLDQGVSELRSRIVPKLAVGGLAFVGLLAVAFVHVLRLLERTQRLEARAAAHANLAEIGTLAAGLAHEIRNPLSAATMNLQLIEEDLEACQGWTEEHPGRGPSRSRFDAVQRELDRLGRLLTDFLLYARPAEPKRQLRRIDDVVRECVDFLAPRARAMGVTLRFEPGLGEGAAAVDEAMIKQALTNVVLNGLEAAPSPGGHVTVSTRCREEACEVEVADDGPGLPEETGTIFEVFQSNKPAGFGLGLAISRSRVERHGGTLTAENAEGGGAVFTITIPRDGP